jgi:3-oxoacyl-[acyl-carrier-protein] synthase II
MPRRVAVTGLGIVSPLGLGRRAFFEALQNGQGGLRPLTRFKTTGLAINWAGEVRQTDLLIDLLQKDYADVSKINQSAFLKTLKNDLKFAFALAAAKEALQEAGVFRIDQNCLIHLGVSLETFSLASVGPVKELAPEQLDNLMNSTSLRTPLDWAVNLIESRYGQAGKALTNCAACAAGLASLGQAYRSVAGGQFELALAGAFDSLINPLALGGFQALGALAAGEPEAGFPLCRPFDVQRRGLVMGEGAAVMVLEPLEKARAFGRRVYGEILGYGASLDAYSLSAPDPAGSGALRAMQAALKSANLSPQDVDHLNTHGTGTILNDPIEAKAIRQLFSHWPKMPVTAVKALTGHAIAASGALEAAACLFTLKTNIIPPNIGLNKVATDCELNHVTQTGTPFNGEVILTNSFGFGGQNSALIFGSLS